MNRSVSRFLIAGTLGGAAGTLLMPMTGGWVPAAAAGAAVGAAGAWSLPATVHVSPLDRMASCAALGVPVWAVVNVLLVPLFAGLTPRWTVGEMRNLLPALVAWILFGASLGLLLEAGEWLMQRIFGPAPVPIPSAAEPVTPARVLILGGGFAGVTAAQHLEQQFGADPSVSFSLVSETNALLFTPMLAEVAASSLEPTHISAPLRTSLKRTRIIQEAVVRIDVAAQEVHLQGGTTLAYDHLVLALGARSNYLGNRAVEENSLDFKTLTDAIRIRNHVIAAFDRADTEINAQKRRALLTFVVAGGGFSGAELAGGLNDFTRGMLADYPDLPPEELSVVLVHARDTILPELPPTLANYALERMRARGVIFKLGVKVTDARPGTVVVGEGEEIATHTLVWTAGTQPSPLLKELPVERDKRGAVLVLSTLEVPNLPGVWALGDCANIPDAKTGKPCPPTAQFALREAKTLARNVRASLRGERLEGFHFDNLGTLCVVGHHVACADVKGFKFSGLFAWLMWRGIYLSKLPGLERKVRVLSDWIIELFFPRDIVQTLPSETWTPAPSTLP